MSIRTRLLLLVFAVWLPAAAGFSLLAYSTYVRETQASKDRLRQFAESLNDLVERELDKRAVMAKTLAASSAVKARDFKQFHDEASAATRGTGDWAFVFDRNTQLVNTALPSEKMVPFSRRANAPFETAEPNVYFNTLGEVVNKPVLGMFAPEANVSPAELNVGIAFEPSVIQAILDRQEFAQGSVGAVIDRDLRVMARSRDPGKWLGAQATGDLGRRARLGEVGFAESTTLDGVPSLTYLTRPNRYNWTVVVALPIEALSRSVQRVTLQAATASGLLLLMGLGLALFVSRGISAPVVALRHAANELGKDKIPARLTTGLTEADDVSVALQQAGLRSQAATQTLETRVAQAVEEARTAQATLLEARRHEAIGRLTGGLAHDFNNLLQTISTGHQVLERYIAEDTPKRVLQTMKRATAKAAELIRQMLAFGRTQTLEPQSTDLADFVLKSQELAGRAVGERIALKANIESGLPPLFVDPSQLELALLNLIFNARDAMPNGGNIVIGGREPLPGECDKLGQRRFVCVEVIDDGPGIDENTLARVFEPYFTTKPVGAGSGLGLAQAQAFARQSGGDIDIQSKVGAGTTVRMFLPASDVAPTRSSEAAMVPSNREARTLDVLMVEDDVLVASVVVSALQEAGHRVTVCTSSDAALGLLGDTQHFDVLFTDVVMPGAMTGFDLVEWCRAHRPELPAIVATGYSTQRNEHSVRVLRKPYAMADLLAALQEATHKPADDGPAG